MSFSMRSSWRRDGCPLRAAAAVRPNGRSMPRRQNFQTAFAQRLATSRGSACAARPVRSWDAASRERTGDVPAARGPRQPRVQAGLPPASPIRTPTPETPMRAAFVALAFLISPLAALRAELADRVVRYEVTERFVNRGSGIGEADYLFPLPRNGAFQDLKLEIDGE